jgi:uncharacterized protein
MPEYLAPGVYVEEIPADVQPIAGVPTSTTAFLGATRSGPVDVPRLVRSFAEFKAHFGGLAGDMPLGYAVQQYFLNGGREAVIARVVPAAAPLTDADLSNPALEANKRGLWLLEHGGRFDLLCIPPLSPTTDVGKATWNNAIAYATRRNAVVIVDPPAAWTTAKSVSDAAVASLVDRSSNAALYFPRLKAPDPLRGNKAGSFAPCGAVAGIYARIDGARGVWKAPAGPEAIVLGAQGLGATLTEGQLSTLEGMGVNTLRVLPDGAIALWGARTLAGADISTPQLKYVPVRRLQIFIETSIRHGLRWTVLEPHSAPLWAQVRTRVTDFMHDLFRQGALQGEKPEQAYFVRCDATTMTQHDLEQGILNVVVGFAPLKPAEFVIVRIGLWTKEHAHTGAPAQSHQLCRGRYSLRVIADGHVIPGMRRVHGLGQHTELVTVHDGSDPSSSHVIIGRTTFDRVTLERGFTADNTFATWARAMQYSGGPPPRKNVRIELRDAWQRITAGWDLSGALPVKYAAPDLDPCGNAVAIEEITLDYDGLKRDDDPRE